ncbi:hypothetical protein O3M35_011433 [Rhynocoris fuscipes]|uniref:Sodium-coupled monocarboxylate transporter 1 n=1 Tax=Rhynocoris fuscipes TaxID=488301 RepID=A0AAW1D2D0_9HEMI
MPQHQTLLTVSELNWFEFLVFFGMLAASALIGIYFGCIKSAQDTVKEYMLGGKRMPLFPIAMSMIASFISGITLLGIPSETYLFGTQLYMICWAIIISIIILNVFYLPILYHLGSTSIYEYLERRFNSTARCIGSLLYSLSLVLYIPVVIYVPALAFNQVTGMPLHILAPIICTVCIFYTTLGGLKAVVWSDALQSFFTLASLLAVLFLGVSNVGGFKRILEISEQGERIEFFNFDPDPFKRNTFWTVMVGSLVNWITFVTFYPGAYQRYISLPTYKQAKLVSYVMALGIFVIKTITTVIGLIIYTKYHDCDPVATKVVSKVGQILPHFVLDVSRNYPGLTGLFLSGVVSTALSTMSTSLNAVAGTMFEDFIKPLLPWKASDKQSSFIMKCLVIITGLICTGMVFVVANMGTIMQGAIVGSLTGLGVAIWVSMGAQLAIARGDISFPGKVTSIDNCPPNMTLPEGLNSTRFGNPGYGTIVNIAESVPYPYRISYLYIGLIGLSVALIVGTIVSLLTGPQNIAELDPALIIPQLRWLIPHYKDKSTELNDLDKYTAVATEESQKEEGKQTDD